jgi:transposase-like protein
VKQRFLPRVPGRAAAAERALLAVIQEAHVLGVSTRRVDDLVRTLGIVSIGPSEVSRICAALGAEVAAVRG